MDNSGGNVYQALPKKGSARKAWLMYLERHNKNPYSMSYSPSYGSDQHGSGGQKGWLIDHDLPPETRQMGYCACIAHDFYPTETVKSWEPYALDQDDTAIYHQIAELVKQSKLSEAIDLLDYHFLGYENVSQLPLTVRQAIGQLRTHDPKSLSPIGLNLHPKSMHYN